MATIIIAQLTGVLLVLVSLGVIIYMIVKKYDSHWGLAYYLFLIILISGISMASGGVSVLVNSLNTTCHP